MNSKRPDDSLHIESYRHDPDIIIVRIKGRFDAHAIDEVESVVMDAIIKEKVNLVMDLKGITYMGSGGIRLLLAVTYKIKDTLKRFAIFGIPDAGMRILDIMEITHIFNIFKSESAALEYIRKE